MRISLLILMIVLPCLIFAATLSVKQDGSGDYTVIQDALDAADPGDTVLVYPGRYLENLMMEIDNITLMSLEATTGDPAYIDSTIIDGNNTGRGIIVSRDTELVIIRGLSITNCFTSGGAGGIGLAVNSSSTLCNLKIFNNTARTGGGINIGAATVTLSGVDVYDNYALQLGGGIYAASGEGYINSITFDPDNRCSIYNNRAGAGQDIYIQHADQDLDMPLDIFTVAEPSNYYAIYLSDMPIANSFQINFDILNAHHQEIDSDLYVSTVGDDANDGLSPGTALKTIHEAIYRVASDSLNQKTVHILPGDYSRTDNDQVFPIALKSWVIVQGCGIDTTTVVCEPHPEIPLSYGWADIAFTNYAESVNTIQDLSITTRGTNDSGAILLFRMASLNLKNVRVYDVMASTVSAIQAYMHNAHESLWDNVTVENINSPRSGMVYLSVSDTPEWEMTAMSGRIMNSKFRNAVSTYESSSVWAIPLVDIRGDKELSFENCEFSNLTIQDDNSIAIAIGGVDYPQQQNHFSLYNCLFSNNISPGGDIGGIASICSANNPRIDIVNCTFAGNQGDAYTLMINGNVNIVNSIFDNDTPYQIKVNPMDGDPNEHTNLTIDHSLIKDGIAGILPYPVPGNTIDFLPSSIDADPLFTRGFDIHDPLYYSLSELSPCIDSGTFDISELDLLPYDLAGNQRVWNNRIDMGAFEFGAPPVANDDPTLTDMPAQSLTAYPNPFRVFTNFRVSSMHSGSDRSESINNASITIYNIKGQKVKSYALDPKKTGEQFTFWDGRDVENTRCSSGIYFVNLIVNGRKVSTKKVTLIR